MTRFKTSRRLWLWLTISLWLSCWFVPIPSKGGAWNPLLMFRDDLHALLEWNFTFGRLGQFIEVLLIFSLATAVAAALIAWVIHCPIVMLMTTHKKAASTDH